jgi:DNA-binding transcriptional ArsR family regulator
MEIDQLVENAALAERYMKILANQNRLMILCSLVNGELSVGELNAIVPLSQSALSQHLAILREQGMVSTERDGQTIRYAISDEKVSMLMQAMYEVFCASVPE